MNYLSIAWRNLWRNKRRTLITIASVFFGVVLATLMYSLMDGVYGNMIDMMVKLSTGYIQVQDPEYRDTRSVNNIFYPDDDLMKGIESTHGVTTVARRLDAFALLSSGPHTRGGAVIGFEPGKDSETSNLARWISHGSFLEDEDKAVLVTANVASHLNLEVNDSIILIGQGYRGVTAAGLYPVGGILTFSTPQMNDIGVFMDISLAQDLFRTEGMVTSLMIMLEDYTYVEKAQRDIEELTDKLVVVDWRVVLLTRLRYFSMKIIWKTAWLMNYVTVMNNLQGENIKAEIDKMVENDTSAISDAYKGYNKLKEVLRAHEVVNTSEIKEAHTILPWFHSAIGNAKKSSPRSSS